MNPTCQESMVQHVSLDTQTALALLCLALHVFGAAKHDKLQMLCVMGTSRQ